MYSYYCFYSACTRIIQKYRKPQSSEKYPRSMSQDDFILPYSGTSALTTVSNGHKFSCF